MANDKPTSLRMGFGGKQAFEAGIEGFSVPSSEDMNIHLRREKDEKELEQFLQQNPSLRPEALRLLEAQKAKWPFLMPRPILLELRRLMAGQTAPKIDRRGL